MKSFAITRIGIMIFMSLLIYSCTKDSFITNPPPSLNGDYSVFAWNDVGMNFMNPTYDKLVILPPSNNLVVQVVKRGNPPAAVTTGIKVSYKLINNSSSYGKRAYGGFWDNALKLFGVTPAHDIGLKGNGLSGDMTASGDHFIAEGIPAVPVDDGGIWNPYQVAEITVRDNSQTVVAKTQATIPTSDEINCAKCHGSATVTTFDDILAKHDANHGTSLSNAASQPVLCASCHADPALGTATGQLIYLSEAIHGTHASVSGITCYDCHQGQITKFNRSLPHSSEDGNCTLCHGTMANIASTIAAGRVPWTSEPQCVTCHAGIDDVNTNSELFKDSRGHGNMYCSACHGSPHATFPSRVASDNYQSVQYQGFSSKIKTIGSCGVCHDNSRGEEKDIALFSGVHGGSKPPEEIGCRVCHTSIPSDTKGWPHGYTWKNTN